MKDVLGIYHVGLEVHGAEYTFGNYHAKNSRPLGGVLSGVCAHEPQRAGPRYVLKDSIYLGTTAWTSAQVQEAAEQLGSRTFTSTSYDKINHNCVDFVRSLGALLGATELPLWCYRASSMARLLGNMGAAGVAGVQRAGVAAAQALPIPSSSCMIPSVDDHAEDDVKPWDVIDDCKRSGRLAVEECRKEFGKDDGDVSDERVLVQDDGTVEWVALDDALRNMGIDADSADAFALMNSQHPPEVDDLCGLDLPAESDGLPRPEVNLFSDMAPR
jgi:hypothetical protein